MNAYRYRILMHLNGQDDEARDYFQATTDEDAVRGVWKLAEQLDTFAGHVRRIVVESVILGTITPQGECTTTVDRGLYDSSDLDTSIISEYPEFILDHIEQGT